MRRLAALALLVAACTSNSATTTTIDPLPLPPSPTNPTTTNPPTTTTLPEPIRTTYEGALPDGTTYTVSIEGAPREEATSFGGVVMFEGSSGPMVAAETLISFLPVEGYSYQDGEYRIPADGAGSFILKFYDHVLDELGPDAESIITGAMTGSNHLGMPRLLLQPPFRWMTPADQIPTHLQVQYETFVVRLGCEDLAIACNVFHGIQVIPMERVSEPARPFEGQNVSIQSSAARLDDDPYFLDPGPLSPRNSADVLWTGQEMIVWGGSSAGVGPHVDGAAFNPESDRWRPLDGPPLEEGTSSRAIWGGEQMLVITPQSTFVGDPVTDEWEAVGFGYRLREDGSMVMIGDDLYVWALAGIAHMDGEFQWSRIPDPGFGGSGPWHGHLFDFGGNLVATGTTCHGRRVAIWTGSDWSELRQVRFNDCSNANQTAVVQGELMLWSTERDPTYIYDAGELSWDDEAGIPLDITEGPSGPVVMEGQILVLQFDVGAVFDVATRTWKSVDTPGWGTSTQMVWTGDEILAWVANQSFLDAWRWTPPESG